MLGYRSLIKIRLIQYFSNPGYTPADKTSANVPSINSSIASRIFYIKTHFRHYNNYGEILLKFISNVYSLTKTNGMVTQWVH